jgi:hypothetical protein
MSLKRSHVLYLQSKNRESGTTSQYTISLPEVIESDPNLERFKISLQSFSVYYTWYLVKDGSNTISIDGGAYTLPNGTYTYQRLARLIESITGASVTWLTDSNKMLFTFNTSKTITFDGLGTILGFLPYVEYTGQSISSPLVMTPYEQTHLLVHLNNVSPMYDHLCLSNHTGEVRMANILGKVLVNASPFQLVTYQQVLENQSLYSNDNSLGVLEILITDNDGNIFTDMVEHEMVLTIESVDVDDFNTKNMIDILKDMKQTLKDLLVYQVLKRR